MPKHEQPEPLPNSHSEQAAADALVLARETMTGDIRDFILDRLKNDHNPLPWNMRKEASQRETIAQVTEAVERLARKAVDIIAADGKPVLRGILKKVVIKDGYQCQVDFLASDPLRHVLADSQGQTVMLAIATPEEFEGARSEVKINKDQKAMFDDPEDQGGE